MTSLTSKRARGSTAARRCVRRPLPCALFVSLLSLVGCESETKSKADERLRNTQDASSSPRRPMDGGKREARPDELDASVLRSSDDEREPLGPYPSERADRPAFCASGRVDAVLDLFCGEQPLRVGGLTELQRQLRLALIRKDDPDRERLEQTNTLRGLVFLGHSTALSGALVSPINPRMLLLGSETSLAFQRGVQAVEIASLDRRRRELNFYLLEFEQACNARPQGCLPGDLYTPNIESDWTRVHVRDDNELANTPSDCRQCHQRGRDTPMLLMRELVAPWTHFFAGEPALATAGYDAGASADGGEAHLYPSHGDDDLVAAYRRAKGEEDYGGAPSSVLGESSGFLLQVAVEREQPLEFESPIIQEERALGDAAVPSLARRSPTWDRAYESFKRGENLALPHFAENPTDPVKAERLSQAYRRYRSGELAPERLPDLSDIFPDDPRVRAEIGLQTVPGATPAQALVQACGACHNDVLDQTLSRARFNIDLARMDRRERELAIERIERPENAADVMPPRNARQLGSDVRAKLIAYLRADSRSAEDDELLARAAELGMAGNVIASRDDRH